MRHNPRATRRIVQRAIENKGIEEVKKIVYGNQGMEITALVNFINGRLFAKEIKAELNKKQNDIRTR